MIDFYYYKGNDMLKLGCTLPNLADICLHKSTDSKFHPVTETENDLLEKMRDVMVGGPSIVFNCKPVVDETFIRKWDNLCKSIVGIDGSQLYAHSMCQPMPIGSYARWEYDSETQSFTPRRKKIRIFEKFAISYFQLNGPACRFDGKVTTGRQKFDCFSLDGVCDHCNTVFQAMGCFYHYCPFQDSRSSLADAEIGRGKKKRLQDEMRRGYIQPKGYEIVDV